MAKLVFVSHTVYPDFIGGREHHIHHLARAFSKDHEVVVVGGSKLKRVREEEMDGYRLVCMPAISVTVSTNPLQAYRIIPGLHSRLAKERPDLIHAFEYGSDTTRMAYRFAKSHDVPFFVTVYGYVLVNPFIKMAKSLYDFFLGRAILDGADGIFCISQTQYEEIAAITKIPILKNTLKIQANGIMCSDFLEPEEGQAARKDTGGELRILVVSRLLPRKKVDTVILALSEVMRKRIPQRIKLIIAGPDCGERRHLEGLVKTHGLEKDIEFTGPVAYGKIKMLFEKTDIFVLPSAYEGLPLALLEAMACGKAVIFSNIEAGRKAITDGIDGILVEPYDAVALGQAIIRLVQDDDHRIRIGRRAREKVRQFDSSIEKEKIAASYNSAWQRRS